SARAQLRVGGWLTTDAWADGSEPVREGIGSVGFGAAAGGGWVAGERRARGRRLAGLAWLGGAATQRAGSGLHVVALSSAGGRTTALDRFAAGDELTRRQLRRARGPV